MQWYLFIIKMGYDLYYIRQDDLNTMDDLWYGTTNYKITC